MCGGVGVGAVRCGVARAELQRVRVWVTWEAAGVGDENGGTHMSGQVSFRRGAQSPQVGCWVWETQV